MRLAIVCSAGLLSLLGFPSGAAAADPGISESPKVGTQICYDLASVTGRSYRRCIGAKRFQGSVAWPGGAANIKFAGATIDVSQEALAGCSPDPNLDQIDDRYEGKSGGTDPSKFVTTELVCSAEPFGGTGRFTLFVRANGEYFLPVKAEKYVCGPEQVTTGSAFDKYVRSRLGPPKEVELRNGEVANAKTPVGTMIVAYYWASAVEGMKFSASPSTVGEDKCRKPDQTTWEADIVLIGKAAEEFNAYERRLEQQRRDSSFTKF